MVSLFRALLSSTLSYLLSGKYGAESVVADGHGYKSLDDVWSENKLVMRGEPFKTQVFGNLIFANNQKMKVILSGAMNQE